MALTGFVASMAVNTLVTGLIVFKIINFKVFLTSVERTLGSTRGTTFRHTIFIIIESGMALFAVQLVRVVLSYLPMQLPNTVDLAIGINQMIIVIITSVYFSTFFVSLITITWIGNRTDNNFGAGLNEIVLR